MSAWTVLVRGIRFRAGRSLLVLLLAAVAIAAPVVAVGYQRAAQASVLTDGLSTAPGAVTSVTLTASGATAGGGAGAEPTLDDAYAAVRGILAAHPGLTGHLGTPVAGVDTDTVLRAPDGSRAMARLAFRDRACANVQLSGQCPTSAGEAMVSRRSAAAHHIAVGSRLTLRFDPAGPKPGRTLTVTVVGLYTPRDPAAAYWGPGAYFAAGTDPSGVVPDRLDAVFTPAESDVRTDPAAPVSLRIAYPLRPDTFAPGDVDGFRHDLTALSAASPAGLHVDSGAPQVLDAVAAAQRSLGRTVPIVAVPLVVLCLVVLFVAVAALAAERAPEVALARLRGFTAAHAARFGVAEMVVLIVLAAPIGIVLGAAVVMLAAGLLLAPGAAAGWLGWSVWLAAVLATLAGAGCAVVAERGILRRPVLGMLRRVPARRAGWRAGAGEAAAVVAAAAAIFSALRDRTSPLALLAPPLLALVAALAVARLLAATAARRVRGATRRGTIAGLLSGARIAREPGRRRIVVVVTVAVALLVFGATAWDCGVAARHQAAGDALGADRVYTVTAPYPAALVAAVTKVDPAGNSMAVVRTSQRYGGSDVPLIGVESALLPKIVTWRGASTGEVETMARRLRPATAPPITIGPRLTVSYDVVSATPDAVALSALVEAPGQPPVVLPVAGPLTPGPASANVAASGCAAGCRLLGLRVGPADPANPAIHADLRITSIDGSGQPVTDFTSASAWRADTTDSPDAQLSVTAGASLAVRVGTKDLNGVLIAYEDSPDVLPVVLAGGAPADDPKANTFSFPGLSGDPQPYAVVARADRLPRVGDRGLLFDLGDAAAVADRSGTLADQALQYEVWANAAAPADLATRLASAGIPVRAIATVSADLDQLSRGAPTLGLWLYLAAGGIAVLLAAGMMLLGTYLGGSARAYEYAALKVAGVRSAVLRRAVRREYATTLGTAWLVGLLAGLAGAVVMLPGVPLVSVGDPVGDVPLPAWPDALALLAAVILSAAALVAVVWAATRQVRRGTPDRLREGLR